MRRRVRASGDAGGGNSRFSSRVHSARTDKLRPCQESAGVVTARDGAKRISGTVCSVVHPASGNRRSGRPRYESHRPVPHDGAMEENSLARRREARGGHHKRRSQTSVRQFRHPCGTGDRNTKMGRFRAQGIAMAVYDETWKEAMNLWFELFVAFFFPHVHRDIDWTRGWESLDKELQQTRSRRWYKPIWRH